MRAFLGAHQDWLTVIRLPTYAPDLNPAEGVRSVVKNGLATSPPPADHLAAIVRNRLKRIQYRPERFSGFLVQTELTLNPAPP
jgi:putative transposase